jgi:hypothetical protein
MDWTLNSLGCHYYTDGGPLQPLDADWLARVANDPGYKNSLGNSVYQEGQTSGMYYNVTGSGLAGAFQDISSQILRLAQ